MTSSAGMTVTSSTLKDFMNFEVRDSNYDCVPVADFQAFNFIKTILQRRCFPVNFAKFLRTLFFTEHLYF